MKCQDPISFLECFHNSCHYNKFISFERGLVFIDEIDSFGSRVRSSHIDYTQTINRLLTEMDGFDTDNSLTVLGATNSADSLDPALLRPGRFDRIIEIPLPNENSRKAILEFYFSLTCYNTESITPALINELAHYTAGFSQADLKNLVNESAIISVRENSNAIDEFHVEKAFKEIQARKIAAATQLS